MEMVKLEELQLPRHIVDRLWERVERLDDFNDRRRGPDWELQKVVFDAILGSLPMLWSPGDEAWLDGATEPLIVEAVIDQGRQLVLRPVDPGAGPWACVWASQADPNAPDAAAPAPAPAPASAEPPDPSDLTFTEVG